MAYFLGTDAGGTKTHAVIADETGRVLGVGAGPGGNHQAVGYERMHFALETATTAALHTAGVRPTDLTGSAFALAGYDWPSEYPRTSAVLDKLGLSGSCLVVNDTVAGLVAGSDEGWGVAVVSGTGCNCWGWDRTRERIGRVTGFGLLMGEHAGASEMVYRAMQYVGYAWTRRFPATRLTDIFLEHAGADSVETLLQWYTEGRYRLSSSLAPRIVEAAAAGDEVGLRLMRWVGEELAEMANAVVRQLGFEALEFPVVLIGSMFENGEILVAPMREKIHSLAPGARLTRLSAPPVVGSVQLALMAAGFGPGEEIKNRLLATLPEIPPYEDRQPDRD